MNDLVDRQAATQIALEFIVEYLGGAFDEDLQKKLMERMNAMPPAQPDWGKPVGNGRPLADSEVIPRLQAIKAQIGGSYAIDRSIEVLEGLQGTQPECIQNNAVHLCDSCQYTYATCPSHGNDAVFGDGKGNDNICACNKYRPISAQPERKKGKWIVTSEFEDCRYVKCNQCKVTQVFYYNKPLTNFCPNCGVDMRGKKDE